MQVFISSFCELLCQSQNYVREAVVFSWWVDSGGLSGGWSMRFKSLEKGMTMATMLCSKVAFQNFKGLQSPGQASILGHLSFPTRSYDDMYFVEVFKVGHGECRTWPVGTPVGTLVGTILFRRTGEWRRTQCGVNARHRPCSPRLQMVPGRSLPELGGFEHLFFLSGQKWAKTSEPFGNQGPHG